MIMKFFDLFPENLFTLFASPNREIYAEALMVVYRQYRQETVLTKQDLVSRLIAHMENRMLDMQEEDNGGEGIPYQLGEEIDLSSRAHFLLRRFLDTRWLEVEADPTTFEECYVLPGYASKLLGLFYELLYGRPVEYRGFVYSTYSNLRMADQERQHLYEALQNALHSTRQLWASLQELLHNIRFYHQRLQEQEEIREILEEHFDRFRAQISDRVYHPVKTSDSVHRFKYHILSILKDWKEDPEVLEQLTRSALEEEEFQEEKEARVGVMRTLEEIVDTYDRLDDLLRQVDRKNSAYTRASVERMQYYLNRDRDLRGKLVEVLKNFSSLQNKGAATPLEEAASNLPLSSVGYLDEYSLYREPRRKREHYPTEELPEEVSREELDREMNEFKERLQKVFSHRKVLEYMVEQLNERDPLTSQELKLSGSEDFIKLLLAVAKSDEDHLPYHIQFQEGYVEVNGCRIPKMSIKSVPRHFKEFRKGVSQDDHDLMERRVESAKRPG